MSYAPSLTVLSDNGKVRAVIREIDLCLNVTYWKRCPADGIYVWKLLQTEEVDASWHVIRDMVHTIVNRLEKETMMTRKSQNINLYAVAAAIGGGTFFASASLIWGWLGGLLSMGAIMFSTALALHGIEQGRR